MKVVIISFIAVILLSILLLVGVRYFQSKLPSTNGVHGAPSVEGPKEAPPGR